LKYNDIFKWLLQCPQLSELWQIYATMKDGANVILPFGTSERRRLTDYIDNVGGYNAEIKPTASVYEEYQINCYRDVVADENDYNVLKIEDVQAICDWIIEQDESGNLPEIEGVKVVAVEPHPFNPQIRFIDPESNIIGYYFTLRVYYVNTAKARDVEY